MKRIRKAALTGGFLFGDSGKGAGLARGTPARLQPPLRGSQPVGRGAASGAVALFAKACFGLDLFARLAGAFGR